MFACLLVCLLLCLLACLLACVFVCLFVLSLCLASVVAASWGPGVVVCFERRHPLSMPFVVQVRPYPPSSLLLPPSLLPSLSPSLPPHCVVQPYHKAARPHLRVLVLTRERLRAHRSPAASGPCSSSRPPPRPSPMCRPCMRRFPRPRSFAPTRARSPNRSSPPFFLPSFLL